jgi:AraC family carnitine catabolism transcriptional activator
MTCSWPAGRWWRHRDGADGCLETARHAFVAQAEASGQGVLEVTEGFPEKIFHHGVVADLVGVGKGVARWRGGAAQAADMAPRGKGARLLAEARVLEWAAVRLFRKPSGDGGGFCVSLRDRDPVKRAIHLLRQRLDQALDLASLSREVGVAPHHLSRRVSAETGTTLQRHLRRLRIEHACEALDSGKLNVTEVALEVGY